MSASGEANQQPDGVHLFSFRQTDCGSGAGRRKKSGLWEDIIKQLSAELKLSLARVFRNATWNKSGYFILCIRKEKIIFQFRRHCLRNWSPAAKTQTMSAESKAIPTFTTSPRASFIELFPLVKRKNKNNFTAKCSLQGLNFKHYF